MPGETESETSFFFVPLGRERGGYLDVLGLPPDADPVTVAAADTQYRKQLIIDFKTQRMPIKEQRDKHQITIEEYHVQEKQLEEVKTRREAELIQLKMKYETVADERRKFESEGRRYVDASWMTMYRQLAANGSDESSARLFPMPEFEPELLERVAELWLKSPRPQALLPVTGKRRRCLELVVEQSQLSPNEAAERQQEYQRQLEQQFQDQKSRIKGQVKRGEIDQTAAQAQVAALHQDVEAEWQLFQQLKAQSAQAHSSSKGAVRALRKNPAATTDAAEPCLASESVAKLIASGQPVEPALISQLVIERELIELLLADSLWGELRSTNRDYWSRQIETWIHGADDRMPKLRTSRKEAAEPINYPCLHRATSLAIDKLNREALSEVAQQPDRRATPAQPVNFQAMLAALRELATKRGPSKPGQAADKSTTPSGSLSAEDFAALLEKLTEQ